MSAESDTQRPPHHCAPSDYIAMIVRLQFIESGEYSPTDFDWRTQAGVLWRMLEYATRPTDASVDTFLTLFQLREERDALWQHLEKAREAIADAQHWADTWKGHAFRLKAEIAEVRQRLDVLKGGE